MKKGFALDRNLARDTIAKACRKLSEGEETRLDRGVVNSAFPPGIDERTAEEQILDFLREIGPAFTCRAVPSGDFIVHREAAIIEPPRPPQADPEPSAHTPPAKPSQPGPAAKGTPAKAKPKPKVVPAPAKPKAQAQAKPKAKVEFKVEFKAKPKAKPKAKSPPPAPGKKPAASPTKAAAAAKRAPQPNKGRRASKTNQRKSGRN